MISETTTAFIVLALSGCAAVKVDSERIYKQIMHLWMVLSSGPCMLPHVSLNRLVLGVWYWVCD